jgi:hypothetical protein
LMDKEEKGLCSFNERGLHWNRWLSFVF